LPKKRVSKKKKFWLLKLSLITLIIAGGISLIAESLMDNVSVIAAAFIILVIMFIGIVFDIIGVAVTACDQAPFIAMASKKIKKAKSAIKLLQNADIVSNICGDVVGDICGIVSGAAGAAIAIKISIEDSSSFIWSIVISSLIAALTIAGKSIGKTIAIKKNKEIISMVSYVTMIFDKEN
jgi:CBS domain containing-hemolysin-like protein